ncbi:hypothetical protein SUGI_0646990 [Cryptomeria japonica]|uniref:putative UDP-rhamnose:rhamnosyltransferase 1 n=1 Tax=Cryptomeria japonica TaxID=3369 RepID=UPI002414C437|nr:putative UDP-rhamnose:rhamnosyltransferase 1 [Cryptomeria japonica]GLJ32129.1 hypothetical protein SUGI_0646990 [Cryptomeria japonica]
MKDAAVHVLMFPWLAQGHVSPFLELSKRLADHGLKVSFLSTPRNISKIKSSLDEKWAGKIDMEELPLPSVEGLPPEAENTADIPMEMADLLKIALDGLQKPLEDLLQRIQPDYIIHDFSQHWAAKFGIPAIYFCIYSATTAGYLIVPSRNKPTETTVEDLIAPPLGYPSSVIAFRRFEATSISPAYNGHGGEDVTDVSRLFKFMEACKLMLVRSCFELESKYIRFLEVEHKKRVIPIGLLLSETFPASDQNDCLRWLDNYPPSSVVYVSFGSECFLSKEQVAELAKGLEESHVPFLWVLRSPRYNDDSTSSTEDTARALLPEGFEERTRERGVVYCKWAPQQQILCHPSTGGFVSHCGWSSVLEAVKFGVKIIALPMHINQGLDARLVAEELCIGVEVGREEDGSFRAEEIRKCVREIMVGEEGRRVAENMDKVRERLFGEEEIQETYIREFIKHLL